ncbi:(d)CMP kinase [Congregibacter litoralis]|uniref:Cytidylate kinase n=1 Tax=Congregibacter litoralis KT71 TaxID=314285 RepID=A4AAR8_9GAMM|nr:(d)CMP kinase [Congregibacter litoralis]EAQ96790.1 cytidylate kinase [Congregibacter litoralis KT71]
MSVPVITVDGPGGAGKGTLCYSLGSQLGWHMLDSGALYRVTALAALEDEIPLSDDDAVAELARHLKLSFVPAAEGLTQVLLDGRDISLAIRSESCSAAASKVAAMGEVRAALLARQRQMAVAPGLVADGRDMGTVVFPDAPLKIFLTASARARAERRHRQLMAKGESVTLARLLETIEERDARDRNRAESPLVPANDALVIDSTGISADSVLDTVLQEARLRELVS